MASYELDNFIWTDSDFDLMVWHDATIWSMASDPENFEFMVDLDYIFRWVDPDEGETYYKFWVCPVTMVFQNASDIQINVQSQQGTLEVDEVLREHLGPSPNGRFEQYSFRIRCQEGSISLEATGYAMYVRQAPSLLELQSFSYAARGGISFRKGRSDA